MASVNSADKAAGAFTRLAAMLLCIEWVRGAFLVAYLPVFAVSQIGLSPAVVGLAVSVHYLTDSAIKSFAGYLLDKYRPRLVLNGGFALALAGFVLMATSRHGWELVAASGLLGAGLSPAWIVCLSQVSEENRAASMGKLYIYWMAGLGLGPVLLNLVWGAGDRAAVAAIAAVFAIGWLLAAGAPARVVSRAQAHVPLREQIGRLRDGLKRSKLLLPGMLLQTLAAGMLVPFLSTFATDQLGLSHAQFSAAMITGGGSVVLLLVPMGKWYDSRGGKSFLVAGLAAFALSLCGLTGVHSFAGAVSAALLMGCAYATLLPAWNALMAHHVPADAAGMGWGVFSSVEGIGVVVGPLLGSALASAGGAAAPFWVSAAIFGALSVWYLRAPSSLYPHPTSADLGKSPA
ncbi:MFS transporter [Cohnella nanjingensis]|uniref:MFS transporter n=1 Tax=Cohnella nanjingensis TaxID=1387779 RepID=A0A7X0RS04_9BACL|nr:MFS transporter [Cohnella nanjingensis]MBB6671355.1 MFS transporter [Cohnella nanjingensis]